jgi:hypothetical protein
MPQLLADNRELLGLLSLLAVSMVASILLHWLVICRYLYRHGARLPTGLLFWRVFRELRQYKDLVTAGARPPTAYFFGFILAWFNLLLAFAIALRILWVQSPHGAG